MSSFLIMLYLMFRNQDTNNIENMASTVLEPNSETFSEKISGFGNLEFKSTLQGENNKLVNVPKQIFQEQFCIKEEVENEELSELTT